jgi:ABC transporter substrate binding protein
MRLVRPPRFRSAAVQQAICRLAVVLSSAGAQEGHTAPLIDSDDRSENAHARHQAARFHRSAQRRGCCLAAGGARAELRNTRSRNSFFWHWFRRGLAALRQGLAQAGWVDGRNVAIEFRSAQTPEGDRLPQLAADLVRRQVALIAAAGAPGSVLAAKAATSTVPIVFVTAADPVKYGFVASLDRPGGNVTGISFLSSELEGKRLNLLLELIPQATTVGYLSGPSNAPGLRDNLRDEMLEAARAFGRQIIVLKVEGALDLESLRKPCLERSPGACCWHPAPRRSRHTQGGRRPKSLTGAELKPAATR